MRIMTMSIALAIGCGDGSTLDPQQGVADLDRVDQVALCESFIDDVCAEANPELDSFCNDTCITSSCGAAADAGHIDTECNTVDVGDVQECAETFDLATCVSSGGGCMFDAVEAACP